MLSLGSFRHVSSLKAGIGPPGARLPVIRGAGFWDPGRNRYGQIAGHRFNIRLIHLPKLNQFLVGGASPAKLQAVRFQGGAQTLQLRRRKAVLLRLARRPSEDQREVYDRVPGNGEGQLSLSLTGPLQPRHNECAGVENCGERPQPGLVIVLGTEIGEHGISESIPENDQNENHPENR